MGGCRALPQQRVRTQLRESLPHCHSSPSWQADGREHFQKGAMRDLCCLGLLLPPHCALSPSPHFCTETGESPGHLPRGLLPHPAGSGEGGREGKAATQGLYSPAEHEAEGFHSSAALTFAGMAARYETARVGSEASLLTEKHCCVGQR